jgi:hypothetical protein
MQKKEMIEGGKGKSKKNKMIKKKKCCNNRGK